MTPPVKISRLGGDGLWLPMDLSPRTPVTPPAGALEALAYIGDSLTRERPWGGGPDRIKASLMAKGWLSTTRVDGVDGRKINGTGSTNTVSVINSWRAAGFDPKTWVFALGRNDSDDNAAQWAANINAILDKVAEGGKYYTVWWVGPSQRGATNNFSRSFWTTLTQVAASRSDMQVKPIDFDSLWHNQYHDPDAYWYDAWHMTEAGYAIRRQMIANQITAPANHVVRVGMDLSPGSDAGPKTYDGQITYTVQQYGLQNAPDPKIGHYNKYFDGAKGIASAVGRYNQANYKGIPVLCHKVDRMSDYTTRLDQITKPEVWVFMQEWEGKVSPTDYNAAYLHMDQARRNHPNGHLVELLMCGFTYGFQQGRGHWNQTDPAAAHVEYVGEDTYIGVDQADWADEVQISIDWHNSIKGTYPEYKGFALPEFGVNRYLDDKSPTLADPNDVVARWQDVMTMLTDAGCLWVNNWNADWRTYSGKYQDWRMEVDQVTRDYFLSILTH